MVEVSNKWKNLRDHFYREIKLLESGQANKKRKYIYFDDMEFVRPYIGYKLPPTKKREHKCFSSTNISQDIDDDVDIDLNELLKTNDTDDEDKNTNSLKKIVKQEPRRKSMRVMKPSLKATQNKSLPSSPLPSPSQREAIIKNFDVLRKTTGVKNSTYELRDGDISFCLSLVPTLRKMSDTRKLKVKIDILKVLHQNMEQIERMELKTKARFGDVKHSNQSLENDEMLEDHLEGGEENINVKQESYKDPLNSKGGNTKTWWT